MKKKLTIYVDEEIIKAMKIKVLEEGIESLSQFTEELYREVLSAPKSNQD